LKNKTYKQLLYSWCKHHASSQQQVAQVPHRGREAGTYEWIEDYGDYRFVENEVQRRWRDVMSKLDEQLVSVDAGYFIDMAIRHPDDRDRFVIGIECDGATYHSSKSARDRDRLREMVLRDRGWKLYRIWSTDWFTNHEAAKEELLVTVARTCGGDSKRS
jgi:very-short-patch-repair endonuclease